jgi:thiamine-monophosphate kinase
MQLKDMGEFGLIGRIAERLPSVPGDVIAGVGDDVAVLRLTDSRYLLATCDIQVEDVHFLRTAVTPFQLGKKAAAVNLSDVAAVGGMPRWALVSLALPQDLDVEFVDELYRGMRELMEPAGAFVVGGNVSSTPWQIVIDVFLMGEVAPEHLVLRRGAREGDLVLVTGFLGDSRAGLESIKSPRLKVGQEVKTVVEQAYRTPAARLREGQALGRSGMVHSMVDVSDGLLSDLSHICAASSVGARIWLDRIPLSNACVEVARSADCLPLNWALTGGEDYELLFTAHENQADALQDLLKRSGGVGCRVIGRIVSETEGISLEWADGTVESYGTPETGWNHFKG